MRIGQALAFQADDGAGLRALRNGDFLVAIQAGHADLGAESGLRDADGNRAIEIRAAPLEKRMFLHVQDDVEIARRAAVGAGLAFAGNADARLRIDARRDAHVDGARALDAAAPAAIRALLANHLARALASGAGARDGKESLLVMELAAALAGLAGGDAGAGFRAGAVAGVAEFLARQANLGGDAGGGFLEAQLACRSADRRRAARASGRGRRVRPKTSSKPKKSPKMS